MSTATITFWGTRGSIPTPGRAREIYGGNTPCLEVRHEDTIIVLDAGSGIREMSRSWAQEFHGRSIKAHLLFTHPHWDHIQGFPFFDAAYEEGNTFLLYGQQRTPGPIEVWLSGQMHDTYFPVPLTAMNANLTFCDATEHFEVGSVSVTTHPLPHPGGCLGYRLQVGNAVFVLATDCELDQVAKNQTALANDRHARRQYDLELLEFFNGVTLLVIDCQYTDEQYVHRVGWGHNALATVVDLCDQAQPAKVALFHHDPQSDDPQIAAMVDDARDRFRDKGLDSESIFAAKEGMQLSLDAHASSKPDA